MDCGTLNAIKLNEYWVRLIQGMYRYNIAYVKQARFLSQQIRVTEGLQGVITYHHSFLISTWKLFLENTNSQVTKITFSHLTSLTIKPFLLKRLMIWSLC